MYIIEPLNRALLEIHQQFPKHKAPPAISEAITALSNELPTLRHIKAPNLPPSHRGTGISARFTSQSPTNLHPQLLYVNVTQGGPLTPIQLSIYAVGSFGQPYIQAHLVSTSTELTLVEAAVSLPSWPVRDRNLAIEGDIPRQLYADMSTFLTR